MPGFDRTGPAGMGPQLGWGRGLCGMAANAARFAWRDLVGVFGSGGYARGGGRGRCFGGTRLRRSVVGRGPSVAPRDETAILRAQIAAAKETLSAMEARLSELEQKNLVDRSINGFPRDP